MKARLPQGYGGGVGNMNNMLKQAQKMQEEMARMQQELEVKEFSVTVGGGAVKAVLNGKKQVQSLEIKPEVVDPDDIEMLQDLIISAINECSRQIDEETNTKMSQATGGMNIPGLF